MVEVQQVSLEMNDGAPGDSAVATVAVAVKGVAGDSMGGGGSRRAVRWAVENLLPKAQRFILVHVIPTIASIPTPTGERIPVDEVDKHVVEMYVQDKKLEYEQVFLPFKWICKNNSKVETLLLEHDDPARALLRFISKSGVNSLVMGSFSSNVITRRLKGPGAPSTVLRYAPETCEVYVVCKDRIVTKSVGPLLTGETISMHRMSTRESVSSGVFRAPLAIAPAEFTGTNARRSASAREPEIEPLSGTYIPEPYSSSGVSAVRPFGAMSPAQHSYFISQSYTDMHSDASICEDQNHRSLKGNTETNLVSPFKPMNPAEIQKVDVQVEVEHLKKELQNTVAKYKQAREELANTQNKVQLLSSECLKEARRVNAALEKEEMMRKAAAQEKEKHLQALKEVEAAKALLAKEFCERQIAEVNALKLNLEKKKIIDTLFTSDRRYRRYTKDEIEKATNRFSPNNVIGEGGYGKVYKCSLDHTPVAVKVLRPDSLEHKEEFLTEVKVLSQLRHPHVVLLLGACPENGCLVYEYLENGSLEEYIYQRNNRPSLPWFIRFRIIFEVACGLAFLHSSKPEPVVHRDLKPGNILLDRNYTSKIGDVGLAKLISDVVPDNVTAYRHSVLAGTIYYMDPEYQRTGTIRPKSDLYAFGIIILQLLTARHAYGLLSNGEDALKKGTFAGMLDKSVTDWPLAEAEELARIGLKCSEMRCRDRPDLEKEVIPALKRLAEIAHAKIKMELSSLRAPSHYFCPILREIMEYPQVAADGFTYEHRAIKAWLEKFDASPVTKEKLEHLHLTPNHTLRAAVQDWRSRMRFSSALIHGDH